MPDWIQTVARYNPLDWAVLVSREALSATPDWSDAWAAARCVARRRHVVARDAGVPGLPAFGLTHPTDSSAIVVRGKPHGSRTNRQGSR